MSKEWVSKTKPSEVFLIKMIWSSKVNIDFTFYLDLAGPKVYESANVPLSQLARIQQNGKNKTLTHY